MMSSCSNKLLRVNADVNSCQCESLDCIHCVCVVCDVVVVPTCFAAVVDWGSLSVGVQSRDVDGIRSVRDQVVQEGIVNISWNQDLFWTRSIFIITKDTVERLSIFK